MSGPTNKPVLTLLGVSTFVLVNAFVFVPFNLYIRNLNEFGSPVWSLLFLMALPVLALMAVIVIAGMFVPRRLYQRYCTLIAVVALLVWLQGNLLVWEYGLLDGSGIDWAVGTWRGWLDLAIWIGAIAGAMTFHRAAAKPIYYMAGGLFVLQLAVLAVDATRHASALSEKTRARNSADALRQLYRFSTQHNVLHIVLDGFQADVFEAITTPEVLGKPYRSAMNGFVFFKNNLGIFPTTYMTVPAILSGKVYRNEIAKDAYARATIGGKTILRSATEAGYEVDLASQKTLIAMYEKAPHTNAYVIPRDFHATERQRIQDEAAQLMDLALFRFAPHFLKARIYDDQRWFAQRLVGRAEYLKFWYFAHTAFLNALIDNSSADRTAPVYKLLHLMSTHCPWWSTPAATMPAGRCLNTSA